jgi:hypothetical protein
MDYEGVRDVRALRLAPIISPLREVIFYKPRLLPSSKRVVDNEGGPVDERCSASCMIIEGRKRKKPETHTASRFPKLAQHRVDGVERGIYLFPDLLEERMIVASAEGSNQVH